MKEHDQHPPGTAPRIAGADPAEREFWPPHDHPSPQEYSAFLPTDHPRDGSDREQPRRTT